jgi:hypothetical protein
MKEYIFRDIINSNIEIKIKAKSLKKAKDLLYITVRHQADFRLIE